MATQIHAAGSTGAVSPGLALALAQWPGSTPEQVEAFVADYLAEHPPVGGLVPSDRLNNPPVTMIERFASGHGWSIANAERAGSLEDSTEEAVFGRQSIKFTTAGSISKSLEKSTLALDLTNRELVVWVRSTTNAPVTFNVFVGVTGSYYTWNVTTVHPGWNKIALGWGNHLTQGTPNRANVTWIRIEAQGDPGGYFGGIGYQAMDTRYPNGVVSFTFDDGLRDAFDKARPLMDVYGYGGTGYLLISLIDTAWGCSLDELHQLEDVNGWEIGGHGYGEHVDLTTLSESAVDAELRAVKGFLRANRFRGQDHFAYPLGAHNPMVRSVASRYFATGRSTGPGFYNQSMPVAPGFAFQMQLRCHSLAGSPLPSLADMKAVVDRAKAKQTWETFLFHDLKTGTSSGSVLGESDFAELLAHVAAQGVAVAPIGEVVRG